MTVSLKYVTYFPMYYMTLPNAGVTWTRNSCFFGGGGVLLLFFIGKVRLRRAMYPLI